MNGEGVRRAGTALPGRPRGGFRLTRAGPGGAGLAR